MADADHLWAEALREQLATFGREILRTQYPGRLDLEDILQVTLIEAAKRAAPSAHPAACLAWLKAAFRHNVQDALRKLNSRKRDVLREVPLGLQELSAKVESPSRRLKTAEQMQSLLQHLDKLPEDQQLAIRLRYIEERELESVIRKMKRSRAAVNGLLRRGLQSLREQLASTRME